MVAVGSDGGVSHPRLPWIWWHLLSLDAPTVAVLWQSLLSRSFGVRVPPYVTVGLFTTVWSIYVLDRLLDAKRFAPQTARHRFYRQYGAAVAPFLASALLLLAWISQGLSARLWHALWLVGLLVGVHFLAIHIVPAALGRHWPKELSVGLIFALGTGLPVWAANLGARLTLWLALLLFAAVCWCNCVAIEWWEARRQGTELPSAATEWLGRHLQWMTLWVATGGLVVFCLTPANGQAREFDVAIVASAILLAWLDRVQAGCSVETVRLLADAALLSPVLLLAGQAV